MKIDSKVYQAIIPAPFGFLGIRLDDDRLVGVDFLPGRWDPVVTEQLAVLRFREDLLHYLQHPAHTFHRPETIAGTPFQLRVWQSLCEIPAGQTISYTQLANNVGSGPRAVANACGANPLPLIIPCHRVVAKNGLGGFMQGRDSASLSIKTWLLQHERRAATSA